MFAQNLQIRRSHRFLPILLGAALFLGLLMVGAPAFAQSPKIGYVDLQRALTSVAEGKAAKDKLKKDFDAKQKKLTDKQENLKKLKDSLEAGASMMTDQAKQEKFQEYQREMAELQQLYMEMQRELAEKETQATQTIFKKMEGILSQIAKEKKYDLILEKTESSVLFAKDGMDLTDELIKRYDK